MNGRRALIACVMLALGASWTPLAVHGYGEDLVPRHDLRCDDSFPCADELRRRVDFWIGVYSKWTTGQAILHDSAHPERVYRVLDAKGCSDERVVEPARRAVRNELLDLADRVDRGHKPRNGSQSRLLSLFPDPEGSEVRSASSRIRCQQGNRDRFRDALARYGRYRHLVLSVLKESNLPEDIHYLPFVESLYNPAAYSRVGAAGMWQIMPGTARVLGLELNATMDERLDPEAATWGAAKYLRDSRNTLTLAAQARNSRITAGELTPFVITSYNYGVAGMRRAIESVGPNFVDVLTRYKSASFRVAVKNFYASFLAARHVASNATSYFGDVPAESPLRYHTVVLKRPTSIDRIKSVYGLGEDELRGYNRALTRFVWHGWRMIPDGYRLRLPPRSDGWRTQTARLESLPAEDASRVAVNYDVKRGDTACGVARAFQVSCRDLIDLNRLDRRATIIVGQNLVIPGRPSETPSATRQVASRASTAPAVSSATYTVRKGDTACQVARRFGADCRELIRHNSLDTRGTILVGQDLRIPGAAIARTTGGGIHTVRRGDTACGVARRYGVDCDELVRFNGLNSRAIIVVGQELRIPGQAVPETEDGRYVVRGGDTPCEIAAQFGVSCADLMRANGLDRGDLIVIDQRLHIPGLTPTRVASASKDASLLTGVAEASEPESPPQLSYSVVKGDTACQIASRFSVPCASLIAANSLGSRAVIRIGQELMVPAADGTAPAPVAEESTEVTEESDLAVSPLDQPVDLSIRVGSHNGQPTYRISVEPEETLGHYADWLGYGSSGVVRRYNGMSVNDALYVGKVLALPIESEAQVATFESKRSEYHRVLVEEFKEHYQVTGLGEYTIRSGDNPWRVSGKLELPFWVITRYNPELRERSPAVGEVLTIPKLQVRG
jgi:membrane-bound lytic murein transglycosylase D